MTKQKAEQDNAGVKRIKSNPVEDPEFKDFENGKRDYAKAPEHVRKFYYANRTKQTYKSCLEDRTRSREGTHNLGHGNMTDLFALADKVIDDSDPDTSLTQIHHALQTAEAARQAMPEAKYDWFHLTGFLHDLGKGPLAITKGYPQWRVVGDTFPMGCKVEPAVIYHDYFQENPDAKVAEYNTENGVYEPGCGFDKLVMSFGHDEYLASVLENNNSTLPPESIYLIRFHSFYPWHQQQAYSHLASAKDKKNLEWLKRFQLCDLYSKVDVPVQPEVLLPYYKGLCDKYLGGWDRELKL